MYITLDCEQNGCIKLPPTNILVLDVTWGILYQEYGNQNQIEYKLVSDINHFMDIEILYLF